MTLWRPLNPRSPVPTTLKKTLARHQPSIAPQTTNVPHPTLQMHTPAAAPVDDEELTFLGEHWSLVSFFRHMRVEGMRWLWKELLSQLPLVEGRPWRQPFAFLHPGTMQVAFAHAVVHHPDIAGLSAAVREDPVVLDSFRAQLEPVFVRKVLDNAAEHLKSLRLTAEEIMLLQAMFPCKCRPGCMCAIHAHICRYCAGRLGPLLYLHNRISNCISN